MGKLFGSICKTPSQVITFHSKSKWLSHYNLLLPKIVPKGSPFQYPPPPTARSPPPAPPLSAPVTWSSLHHSYGSSTKIIRPGGKEVKDKSKTHSPEKLAPSVKGNKTKTTIFRERTPTYSMDDNDGRILGFVGQEDRNYLSHTTGD